MIQLLMDKDAIRFTDGKRIHLNLLKNQIDRRILKITALVNGIPTSSQSNTERPRCQNGCQASIDCMNFSVQMSGCSSKVLGDLNGNDIAALEKKEIMSKCSESKQKCSYLILADSNLKLGLNHSRQLTKGQPQAQSYEDDDLVKHSNSEHSCDNSELNLDLSNIKFDENISYEQQANQLKNYIRSTLSNRKKTMTDRTRPQNFQPTKTQRVMAKRNLDTTEIKIKESNRIVVSHSCMQKMQRELNTNSTQLRHYQMDYKARTNLLKKIQQKYRNDIM